MVKYFDITSVSKKSAAEGKTVRIFFKMAERYSSNKKDMSQKDEKIKNIVVIDDDDEDGKKQEKTKNIIVIDEDEEADELEKDWSLMVEEDGIKLKLDDYNGAHYYVEDDVEDDVEKLWWLRDYDGDDEDEDY